MPSLKGKDYIETQDLSDDELAAFKLTIDSAGIRVSSIGSPIGKIPVTDPFPPHVVRFRRAIEIAKDLDAPFVRVFSFFIPDGDDPAAAFLGRGDGNGAGGATFCRHAAILRYETLRATRMIRPAGPHHVVPPFAVRGMPTSREHPPPGLNGR